MPDSCSAAKKSAVAVHYDNIEVSNGDFNSMMDKKLNESKSSIISELIKNMKNTIQKYKSQLEEVSSTVAMLQQYMTNLNLQQKLGKLDRI